MDCLRSRHRHGKSFDQGRALWLYSGDIQKSVLDYKYKGMKSYTDFYAEETVNLWGRWIRNKNPQMLILVPLHPRKKRIRGFNQAELLARAIGKRMEIPVSTDILYRKRWTEPQKAVSGQERRHNLAKSMEIRHLPQNLRRVMLIDDIYTTGSTMEACAGILKQERCGRNLFFDPLYWIWKRINGLFQRKIRKNFKIELTTPVDLLYNG